MLAACYEFDSAVRGFHKYETIWSPVIGEELPCKREAHNAHDSFAVAVMKEHDVVVGHLPRKFSAVFWSFLRNGSITCRIIGRRRYSRDLVQGGLEVPCTLVFKGDPTRVDKVKGLLNKKTISQAETLKDQVVSQAETKDRAAGYGERNNDPITIGSDIEYNQDDGDVDDQELLLSPKRPRIAYGSEPEWVRVGRMNLQLKDKEIILQGLRLTDNHMNASQKLLKKQFASIEGLCNTLKVTIKCYTAWIPNYLQILHSRGDHWITLTTIGCSDNHIFVFDSLYDNVDDATKNAVDRIFTGSHLSYCTPPVPKQQGPVDCGLYAIAYAAYLAYGKDPCKLTTHHFKHETMRCHLVKCIEQGLLTDFP